MKKILSSVLFSLLALGATAANSGYNIKLTVDNAGLRNKKVYLAFYFNGKTYSKDTTLLNAKGVGAFSGKKPLEQGDYLVYFDSNKFFDVLVGSDQNIQIKADTSKLDKVEVTGAKESADFQTLMNFMADHHKKQMDLVKQHKDKKIDSLAFSNGLDKLSDEVTAYQKQLMDAHKGDWLEAFVKGTIPVDVPDFKELPDSTRELTRYMFKKHHYFDNINLSDPRFLRTPYFPAMVDSYMSKFLIQHPDTLYKAAEFLIEKSRYNKETFQTMCSKMINYGLTSNQMGMDALWSKIAEKYYLTEPRQATWADSSWVEDLRKEDRKVKYNLIGMQARDLRMKDADGKTVVLSEVLKDPANKFMLVYFFEPTCGHCRKTTPVLHDSVYSKFHKLGFEVFAVYTQTDKKEWQEFVEKDKLQDWVNVWDPDRESYFWEFYDATVTPGIYLLDKTGKIIAKKIDMSTLDMILTEELIKRPAAEAASKKSKK